MVFYFVKRSWKLSLSKLDWNLFVYLFILVLLVGQVNMLRYLLFPPCQDLHQLKEEEGLPFLVTALINLIRGCGIVYKGRAVQINFVFLPWGNNKSLSTCMYFVTALAYLYPITNFQILCREHYTICMTKVIFIWTITKHYRCHFLALLITLTGMG